MRMLISFNIGYYTEGLHSGILSNYPHVFEAESFRELSDSIRNDTEMLFKWAEVHHVPRSSICIYFHIKEQCEDNPEECWDWHFRVRMKNCREYKAALDEYIKSIKSEPQ